MDKLTISRILVENKYLLPVTKADTGVHVVDIPKAAEVLNELFQQKLEQCIVGGSCPDTDELLNEDDDQTPVGQCVWCGSLDVTVTDEADICHECGYVYT